MKNCNFSRFQDILLFLLNKLTPIEKKICHKNHNTVMNKSLRKAIMNRSKVKNKFTKKSEFMKIYENNKK